MSDDNHQEDTDDDTQEIENLCSTAESTAESLVAPLRRTVEELDRLYDTIKEDPEKGQGIKELCSEIDSLIFSIKEMVATSSLEVEEAAEEPEIADKVMKKENCEDVHGEEKK